MPYILAGIWDIRSDRALTNLKGLDESIFLSLVVIEPLNSRLKNCFFFYDSSAVRFSSFEKMASQIDDLIISHPPFLCLRFKRFLDLGMKGQHIRTALLGYLNRLLESPSVNFRVIAGQENLGNRSSSELTGLGVLRIFENSRGNRLSLVALA